MPSAFARPGNSLSSAFSASAPSLAALSPFGLSQDALALQPGRPRRYEPIRPLTPPETPQREPAGGSPLDIAGAIKSLDEVLDPKERRDDPLARIEEAIRRIPGLPPGRREGREPNGTILNYGTSAAGIPQQRRAMTPLEGPDTGADNPNAATLPADYYGRLRGPEGTVGDDNAVNSTTGASGPYQFLPSTWRDIMKTNPELGLTMDGFRDARNNMKMHDAAIRAYTDRSMQALKFLGRMPTPGELYATHLFGQQGGADFLRGIEGNVDLPHSWVSANPWLKPYVGKPSRELLKRFEAMMGAK